MSDNNKSPASVNVRTLGCKVNFCDGNALAGALAAAGFPTAAPGRPADVEIVNTCAVTARSVQKARTLIRRLRAANATGVVLVTGCAARMEGAASAAVPEADAVCPSPEDVVAWLKERYSLVAEPLIPAGGFDPARTRVFIKVQDGCASFCSFCVVPFVRGKPKSLELPRALGLLREAVARGYREIVLCGVHLGQYGRDLSGVSLVELMAQAAALDGDFRLRLSSVEPLDLSDEVLAVMSSNPRFCPHLHLPLQSGSDRVLKAMRRPYNISQYMNALDRARASLDNPAITTDIMVGFPGETGKDFELTLDAIRNAGFARGHVFVFSPRPLTQAYNLPERVAAAEARQRSLAARSACGRTALAFRNTLVATTAEIIVEEISGGFAHGLCARYQRVAVPGAARLKGSLVRVLIDAARVTDAFLDGHLV